MKTQKELKRELKEIKKTSQSELERAVAGDLLDSDDIARYIHEVLQYGCQSGAVTSLIYYHDTEKFFTKHADEIDELREELEQEQGEPLQIGYPLTNWLAWLGFEEVTRKLAGKLGLED